MQEMHNLVVSVSEMEMVDEVDAVSDAVSDAESVF
jgi:hypothetical protein